MSITHHFIDGLTKKTLKHVGTNQTPKLLVIHYSVTDTVNQAVAALDAAKLGYHILIEKDGRAFQTRPFTQSAAHPGLSNWKAQDGITLDSSVSRGSVGICLMNKGFAHGSSPHKAGKLIYNPDDGSMQQWETYPQAQIDACRAIAGDILQAYPVTDVVGHHDIAIMGKFDPGPLFDLEELKAMVKEPRSLGFRTKVKSNEPLNLRRKADAGSAIIRELPPGTELHIRAIAYGPRAQCIWPNPPSKKRYLVKWASVDLDGSDTHQGFVHMSGLERTPLAANLAAFL
jgi:N-acetyl-anhydromuramyl-L-alanine amidase AmpD